MEGRYKIENVKERTRIRSRVVTNLLRGFREDKIQFGRAIFEMAADE